MLHPEEGTSTGEINGLVARACDYYRYLTPEGKLTAFQAQKLAERRGRRAAEKERLSRASFVELSDAEDHLLNAMAVELEVDAAGFFTDRSALNRHSLRMLYRCRCRQLQVQPNSVVDMQLPPSASSEMPGSLLSLDFASSYLGQKGVLALAAVLIFCTELRSLVLSGIGICAKPRDSLHFISLLKALRSCQNLQHLDLSFNVIEDHFAMYLMDSIQFHKKLTELNLNHSGLCELVVNKAQNLIRQRNEGAISREWKDCTYVAQEAEMVAHEE